MIIAIGSDHAGFEQKQLLAEYLRGLEYEVLDVGPDSAERCDYPDFAQTVGEAVAQGQAAFGVLVCGTGIGMAIAANKVDGIRAANVTCEEFAGLAREHNNANVVTLSARYVTPEQNKSIIDRFLTTEFAGGRHAGRVQKIMELEGK